MSTAGNPSYRHGRLVWAYLRSSVTGKRENHPGVILDPTDEICQPEDFDPRTRRDDNVVHVIGVSTKYRSYKLPHIRLPSAAGGHPTTRLREDCAAIVCWYHRITIPDDVIGFGGEVPPAAMVLIDQAVRRDLSQKLGRELQTLRQVFDELLGE